MVDIGLLSTTSFPPVASAILLFIAFGWICVLLMLFCLYAWKGDFKSSYNYRPWKPFDVPEDLATKIDKKGAKWLFFMAGAFLCAMIVGLIYGFVTGNFSDLPVIFLVMVHVWLIIMLAMVIGAYTYAYFTVKKHKTGKT